MKLTLRVNKRMSIEYVEALAEEMYKRHGRIRAWYLNPYCNYPILKSAYDLKVAELYAEEVK